MSRPDKLIGLYLPALLLELALFMNIFALQQLALAKGAGVDDLGLMLSLFVLAYTLSAFGFGRLADRAWLRAPLVVAASVLMAAGFASGLLLDSVAEYTASLAVLGVFSAMYWPALQAEIGEAATAGAAVGAEERLSRDIGGYNVAWSIGKGNGIFLLVPIYERSTEAPLWIAAACAALAGVCSLAGLLRRESARPAPGSQAQGAGPRPHPGPTKRAFLALGLTANFAVWGVNSLLVALFPALGKELGLSETLQSACLGTVVIGQVAAFYVLGSWRGWLYRAWPLLAIEGALALACAAFASLDRALFVPAAFVFGVALAQAYAASLYYSLDYDERHGSRTGTHETVLGGGAFVLPLLGGEVGARLGDVRAPYAFAAAVALAALAAQALLLVRARTRYEGLVGVGIGSAVPAGKSVSGGGAGAVLCAGAGAGAGAAAAGEEEPVTRAEPRT